MLYESSVITVMLCGQPLKYHVLISKSSTMPRTIAIWHITEYEFTLQCN